MKQSPPGNIIVICDGCGTPLEINPLHESAMHIMTALICLSCKHNHTDLEEMKNYAKQTRSYGNL